MKKEKPKSGSLRHIAGNNLFMLRIAWKIAPEVIFSLLISNNPIVGKQQVTFFDINNDEHLRSRYEGSEAFFRKTAG